MDRLLMDLIQAQKNVARVTDLSATLDAFMEAVDARLNAKLTERRKAMDHSDWTEAFKELVAELGRVPLSHEVWDRIANNEADREADRIETAKEKRDAEWVNR